jgi:DNA-directed RNA polymerase specialized sigma24 family protein
VPDPKSRKTSSSSSAFPPTRWTLVVVAGSGSGDSARRALEDLFNIYEYNLYSYLRRWGLSHDQAWEERQEFFLHVVEHSVVSAADPARGRFRDFLLTSLKNHLANRRKHEAAKKRGGAVPHVSIPARWEEYKGRYGAEPSTSATPEQQFEQDWAREVVWTVVQEIRTEFVSRGRTALFDSLITRLNDEGDQIRYAELAAALSMQENAVRIAMFRLRDRLATGILRRVADTVNGDKNLKEEIGYLLHVLGTRPPST